MDEYTAYYLEFNGYIDEIDHDHQMEDLTLEQAIDTAKKVIIQSGLKFCTCAVIDGWTDSEDNVYGWVMCNAAFDTAPYWKEAG